VIFISAIGFSLPAVAKDAAKEKDSGLPSNTIDCKQFKRTGPREWVEIGTAVFDLGGVSDINLTDQPVTPGYFKFGGIELFGVLDAKCGPAGFLTQGAKDQAKGDYDSAIAAFNQAIALDPNLAEAYQDRAGAYEAKGDYARAIEDYSEALKLDPKLESAATQRTLAQEKLAKASGPSASAESQLSLEEAGAALKRGLEQAPDAPKSAEIPEKVEAPEKAETSEKTEKAGIPEKMEEEPSAPPSEDKTASLKIQSESGACRTGKLVYAADGAGDGEGVAPVIEIVLEGKQDEDSKKPIDSEFIIRGSKNNQIEWTYKGTYVKKENSGRFEFTAQETRRRRPLVLPANYIKPNRDGTGAAILYLGGLHSLLNERALKFEGKRPAGALPEAYYFDRCE
jgi:tetratricopeptide (TPR) repeat protein